MLNIENKENEPVTDLVYVVFDPAGPYIQGVYTTTESAAIGARMAMEAEHIELVIQSLSLRVKSMTS